ncbi:polyhydroxybutyrate depolymerase [Brachionus plicatilis]|uniref:Polyhydroxybutyrate depolymerase n=1 Tax=Brachionus plicatilis TaxID=10195 RepID=A0A3M7PMJ4_BRAPC|nr:polyhydroxybutyrate depolymerase [Brachionus plicatilis]
MFFKHFLSIFYFVAFFADWSNAARLGSYRVRRVTVSGISAGGAMANQLHVALSGTISGSGIIAGPPYYCAGGSLIGATTYCMTNMFLSPNVATAISKANSYASSGLIDSLSNLRDQRVYIFSGSSDYVVRSNVVKKNEDFFKNYMNSNNIKSNYGLAAGHAMITDFFGNSCSASSGNYINNCNYNQAYDLLQHLHPERTLQKPQPGASTTGTLVEFDQSEFASSPSTVSLDSAGYVYIPRQCETEECDLHISLHGCLQGKYKLGNVYAANTGYNQVADLNNFIILYPQAVNNFFSNPNGCFDWWGYTDANYSNKEGKQIKAIKAMIDRLKGF